MKIIIVKGAAVNSVVGAKSDKMKRFVLDDEQEKKVRDWQNSHKCAFRQADGSRRGGSFGDLETYCFVPTSIGTIVVVKCACGAEIDVTGEL